MGKLVFVEQTGAWYHEGACLRAAAEEYAGAGSARVVTGRVRALRHEGCHDTSGTAEGIADLTPLESPDRDVLEVRPDVLPGQPVVEVDADGKPTRVTVTAGSAETVMPALGGLRPPTNLKRGAVGVVGAEYEPGNATRYDLLLLSAAGGAKPLLVWSNASGGGRAMFVPYSDIAVSYIAEKLGCNTADAEVVALFLRHALD